MKINDMDERNKNSGISAMPKEIKVSHIFLFSRTAAVEG